MQKIDGGVTAAKGFEAAGIAAHIKYEDRKDLALLYSAAPCVAAGTFTQNVVKAAPVLWDQAIVKKGTPVQAVVINSGIANACTGEAGFSICQAEAEAAGQALDIPAEQVAVASTGVIGAQIPLEPIRNGIGMLAQRKDGSRAQSIAAAEAILTTDTHRKEAAVTLSIDGTTVTIGGMAKGSGMIHPNMCTLLSFVTTDAVIEQDVLQQALSAVVADTYNMISVDGDTSTNDTVLLLANGEAKNPPIKEHTKAYDCFVEALYAVNESLAKQMAGDGEGATALFTVQMVGCASKAQAKTLARSVVSSNLTKTAIAGHDANWGRILCAMGYAGVDFDPGKVDLYFESGAGKIQILKDGIATDYSEAAATKILSQPEITATADLKMGTESATAWGCDLTHDYIRINADYRS